MTPQDESVASLVAEGNERARATYRTYRERAVQSYVSRVCALERISTQTVEAIFASLYRAPGLSGVAGDEALDALLLDTTRRHAADCAASKQESAQTGWGGMLARLGRDSACAAVPKLLAARVSGRLPAHDEPLLERHLARCPRCSALAERFHRAEQTFQVRLSQYPLPQKRPEDPPVGRSAEAPSPAPAAETRAPAAAAAPARRAPAPIASSTPDRGGGETTRSMPVLTRAASRYDLRRAAIVALAIAAVGTGFWLFIRTTAGPQAPSSPPPAEAPRFDTSQVSLTVLDAAGDRQAAELAGDRLGAAGFQIEDTAGTAPEQVEFTTIVFRRSDPVARRQALAVKRKLLPLRSVLQQPASPPEVERLGGGADIVVLAGPDLLDPPER